MDLARYRTVVSGDYLDGLENRPTTQVRALRSECQELEETVSLQRRMVQGRLDIVRHEIDQRRAGAERSSTAELVGSLPDTLTSTHRSPHVDVDEFANIEDPWGDRVVSNLPELGDSTLDEVLEQLQVTEQILSIRRRRLFERIDALADELTRRYRSGEASVDSLLG